MPSDQDVGPYLPQESRDSAASTSDVGKKCNASIEKYRKGGRKPVERVAVINEIVEHLSATMPVLTESELNDAPWGHTPSKSLSKMIGQSDPPMERASSQTVPRRTRMTPRSKRPATPTPIDGTVEGTAKKQRSQMILTSPGLCEDTLLSADYRRVSERDPRAPQSVCSGDPKFAKSSVINSGRAPSFHRAPEWTNIIAGAMVDLDHVISGSFAVTNDNRDTELIGGMEVKFGVTKPAKRVKTSGEWFIAWGAYSKAATFVFPHRKEEFEEYAQRILGLFGSDDPMQPFCHHQP